MWSTIVGLSFFLSFGFTFMFCMCFVFVYVYESHECLVPRRPEGSVERELELQLVDLNPGPLEEQ